MTTTDRRTRNTEAQRRRRERQHEAGKVQFRAWVTADEAVKLKAALTQWRANASAEDVRVRRLERIKQLQARAKADDASAMPSSSADGGVSGEAETAAQRARLRKLRALLARQRVKAT